MRPHDVVKIIQLYKYFNSCFREGFQNKLIEFINKDPLREKFIFVLFWKPSPLFNLPT